MRHRSLALIVKLTVGTQLAGACTYFEVKSSAGAPVVLANTMEWFSQNDAIPDSKLWKAIVSPRGQQYHTACKGGDSWKGKFGFLAMGAGKGVSGAPPDYKTDSLNEAGLSVSEHALRGVSSYKPANATSTHCAADYGTFIASSFSTAAEVRLALPSIALLFSGSGSTSTPGAQWAVADASGDSVVIESTGGSLHIYNNSGLGILTNDPEYPWQIRNLNNYVGLSAAWPDNSGIAVPSEFGQVPQVIGHGQNLLGLPGDVSPPSRFVRTFFIRQYALKASPPKTTDEALVLADGVLNTQFIVKGMNAKLPTEPGYDHVMFATMKVPSEKLYYYKTYEDSQWRRIDLSAVDFSTRSSTKASNSIFGSIDVTRELMQKPLII